MAFSISCLSTANFTRKSSLNFWRQWNHSIHRILQCVVFFIIISLILVIYLKLTGVDSDPCGGCSVCVDV